MRHVLLPILLLPVFLPAQGAAATDPRLQRAILLEETQQDLKGALRLYRAVSADRKLPRELRTRAQLRVALVLRRMGEEAQADTVLRQAAGGEGEAAKRALALLGDGKGRLQHIERLIRKMLTGTLTKDDSDEMAWIGEPIVAPLIAAVDEEDVDMNFVTRAAGFMASAGGAQYEAWIRRARKDYDALKRRAIVRGSLPNTLPFFLTDPDASVRLDALERLTFQFAPHADLLPDLLRDPDERVRHRAWARLAGSGTSLQRAVAQGSVKTLRRLLDLAEREGAKLDASQRASIFYVMRYAASEADPDKQELLFRWLQLKHEIPSTRRSSLRGLGPDAHAKIVLETAKKLGPVSETGMHDPHQSMFASTFSPLPSHWTAQSLPVAIQLCRLGYANSKSLLKYVYEHARPADVPLLLHDLRADRASVDLIRKLPGNREAFAALLPQVEAWLSRPEISKKRADVLLAAVGRMVLNGDPAVRSWLTGIGRRGLEQYPVVKRGNLSAEVLLTRIFACARAGTGPLAADIRGDLLAWQDVPASLRRSLFIQLIKDRSPCLPEATRHFFRNADQLERKDIQTLGGLATSSSRQFIGLRGAKVEAQTVRAALEVGNEAAWQAVSSLWTLVRSHLQTASANPVRKLTQSKLPVAVLGEFLPKAEARWVTAFIPHLDVMHGAAGDAVLARICALPKGEVRVPAYRALDQGIKAGEAFDAQHQKMLADADGRLPLACLHFLGAQPDCARRLRTSVTDLLTHEQAILRQMALNVLRESYARETSKQVQGMFRDPVAKVREAVCQFFASVPDRKVLPQLLDALEDPVAEVRSAAQYALECLEQYDKRRGTWERAFAPQGLGANPVEALVKQASKGPSRIRVAAIRSLGTVGEPQTLPFLIQLMQDSDEAVRQAAAAAVDRINTRHEKLEKLPGKTPQQTGK